VPRRPIGRVACALLGRVDDSSCEKILEPANRAPRDEHERSSPQVPQSELSIRYQYPGCFYGSWYVPGAIPVQYILPMWINSAGCDARRTISAPTQSGQKTLSPSQTKDSRWQPLVIPQKHDWRRNWFVRAGRDQLDFWGMSRPTTLIMHEIPPKLRDAPVADSRALVLNLMWRRQEAGARRTDVCCADRIFSTCRLR